MASPVNCVMVTWNIKEEKTTIVLIALDSQAMHFYAQMCDPNMFEGWNMLPVQGLVPVCFSSALLKGYAAYGTTLKLPIMKDC